MLVWIIEALFAIIVRIASLRMYLIINDIMIDWKVTLCGMFIEDNDLDGIVKIGYVTATCGITSALYLLGMYKND